jgi:hypothetical protein
MPTAAMPEALRLLARHFGYNIYQRRMGDTTPEGRRASSGNSGLGRLAGRFNRGGDAVVMPRGDIGRRRAPRL